AELADVAPVPLVAGLRELLGPCVRVQAVIQPLTPGEDVTAGAIRCLEHGDVMPAADQLVGTAEPADACAGNDDPHGARRLRVERAQRGQPELEDVAARA